MSRKSRLMFALAFSVGLAVVSNGSADDWPQWLGPNRDAVWRENGILKTFPSDGPNVKWRTPIGAGYTGPAVAGGRVYVMDRMLTRGAANPANPFDRSSIPGTERVLCLDAGSGKILWKHEYACPYTVSYAAGPRATPVVRDGKVFTLGAEGHLFCFNADDGMVVWSRDLKKDYGVRTPLWGFSAHPLLDGDRLICLVGGAGSTVVAFDKDNGHELWRALSAKEPGYAPPMIYELGGKRQLIGWHPESINGLDPETGELFWSEPFQVRSGLSVPTPRKYGNSLLITSFYNGARLLRFDSPDKPVVVWQSKKASERDTDTLHGIMSTAFVEDGYIYGVCSYGQLRCLKLETGERIWETLKATTANEKETRWANAFLVKHEDRFFLANELGDLIIAKLTPEGYREISRAHLLDPTNEDPGRPVVWSHPAFANRSVYARNDKEIICVSLAE